MNELSVMVVGKKGILNWQEDLRDAFERIGCRSRVFYVNPASMAEWIEKKRAGATPFLSDAFQRRFRESVSQAAPGLILFLGMIVLPGAFVDAAIPKGALTAAWMPDCVDRVPNADYGRMDAVFYFDSYLKAHLLDIYGDDAKLCFLPLAVNEKQYVDQGLERKPRLLFAGTCTDARKKLLAALEGPIPLESIGPRCKRIPWKRYGARLSADALNTLFNAYDAAVNINQKPNTMFGLNFRPFEASAAGCAVFNPKVPDLPLCFEPDKEVIAYEAAEDLVVQYVRLSKDPSRMSAIARAGRRRTLAEHTFVHRARSILRHLGL